MSCVTIFCQSTVLHVKDAENLSERPLPRCVAHACTLVVSDIVAAVPSPLDFITVARSRAEGLLLVGEDDADGGLAFFGFGINADHVTTELHLLHTINSRR